MAALSLSVLLPESIASIASKATVATVGFLLGRRGAGGDLLLGRRRAGGGRSIGAASFAFAFP